MSNNNTLLTTFIGFAVPRILLNKINTTNLPDSIIVAERGNSVIFGDIIVDNLEHSASKLRNILNQCGISNTNLNRLFCFVEA